MFGVIAAPDKGGDVILVMHGTGAAIKRHESRKTRDQREASTFLHWLGRSAIVNCRAPRLRGAGFFLGFFKTVFGN